MVGPAIVGPVVEIAVIVALLPSSSLTIWLFLSRTLLSSYCSASIRTFFVINIADAART